MDIVAEDGTRLAARRFGRGEPVVLVHGSHGGLGSWDPVVPFLDDHYELWVYARRGYPRSDAARPGRTVADDVSDLRAVVAAAGGSAAVVGGSYGAMVALHAARAQVGAGAGTLLGSIVVFEPPLFACGEAAARALGPYRALLAAGDVAAANHLFAEQVARAPAALLAALAPPGPSGPPAPPDAEALAEARGSLSDLEAMAADTADVERWAGIDVPVLLLQGGETWPPIPATMDSLARVLPAATRAVLPGQLHFAPHTAPDLFARAVREFLGA